MSEMTEVCGCVHWFPRLEDRETCPLHNSKVRPSGHDYFNGANCTWQENPVWPSQKRWIDEPARAAQEAPDPPTNVELLRLLERHHKASIVRDGLLREGMFLYVGSDVYLKTEAALKPIEGATMKDAYGLGDPLRTRVPVWRCPDCKVKCYSRAEYDAHRAEEAALKERV